MVRWVMWNCDASGNRARNRPRTTSLRSGSGSHLELALGGGTTQPEGTTASWMHSRHQSLSLTVMLVVVLAMMVVVREAVVMMMMAMAVV